jgi:hypothetical protein
MFLAVSMNLFHSSTTAFCAAVSVQICMPDQGWGEGSSVPPAHAQNAGATADCKGMSQELQSRLEGLRAAESEEVLSVVPDTPDSTYEASPMTGFQAVPETPHQPSIPNKIPTPAASRTTSPRREWDGEQAPSSGLQVHHDPDKDEITLLKQTLETFQTSLRFVASRSTCQSFCKNADEDDMVVVCRAVLHHTLDCKNVS